MKHYSNTLLPEVGRRGIKALTTITNEVLDVAKKAKEDSPPLICGIFKSKGELTLSGGFFERQIHVRKFHL